MKPLGPADPVERASFDDWHRTRFPSIMVDLYRIAGWKGVCPASV